MKLRTLDYIPIASSFTGAVRLLDLAHVKKVHHVAIQLLGEEKPPAWKQFVRGVVTLIPFVNCVTIIYDLAVYVLRGKPSASVPDLSEMRACSSSLESIPPSDSTATVMTVAEDVDFFDPEDSRVEVPPGEQTLMIACPSSPESVPSSDSTATVMTVAEDVDFFDPEDSRVEVPQGEQTLEEKVKSALASRGETATLEHLYRVICSARLKVHDVEVILKSVVASTPPNDLVEKADAGDRGVILELLRSYSLTDVSHYISHLSLEELESLTCAASETQVACDAYLKPFYKSIRQELMSRYEERKEFQKVADLLTRDLSTLPYYYIRKKEYDKALAAFTANNDRLRLFQIYSGNDEDFVGYKDVLNAFLFAPSNGEKMKMLREILDDRTLPGTTRLRALFVLKDKGLLSDREFYTRVIDATLEAPFLRILQAAQEAGYLSEKRSALKTAADSRKETDPHSAGFYALFADRPEEALRGEIKPSQAVKSVIIEWCQSSYPHLLTRAQKLQTYDDVCIGIIKDKNQSKGEKQTAARYLFEVTEDSYYGYIAYRFGDRTIPLHRLFIAAESKKKGTSFKQLREWYKERAAQDPAGAGYLYAMMQDLGLEGEKSAEPFAELEGKSIYPEVQDVLKRMYKGSNRYRFVYQLPLTLS